MIKEGLVWWRLLPLLMLFERPLFRLRNHRRESPGFLRLHHSWRNLSKPPTGAFVKFVEIGLSDEVLRKLEKAAKEVGLKVPEDLKRRYKVRAEGAGAVQMRLQRMLNTFLEKLREKYKEKATIERALNPPASAEAQVNSESQQVLSYEVGLSDEDLKKLEEVATQVGLEVPENLKHRKVVPVEKKDEAMAELQKELDEFLQDLRETYKKQQYEQDMMRLRGIAETYKMRHPTSHVFINDAGFVVAINPVSVSSVPSKPSSAESDVDVEAKSSEDEKALNENPYAGYEEYYRGLHALRKELNLSLDSSSSSQNPQMRHRTRGVGNVDVDVNEIIANINREQAEVMQPLKLYSDQTMTWEDIQKDQEAKHTIWTLGGFISDKLGLSPGSSESSSGETVKVYESELRALDILGSPATSIDVDLNAEWGRVFAEADLEKPVEEFLKGVGRGAIGVFTFPADIALLAAQVDKFKYLAEEENKSVGEFLKDQAIAALHDPGFYGELFGSFITSMGLSSLRKAMKPKVYVEKGGVQGVRTMIEEINLDGNELAKAVKTELFDLDKTTTITIQKKYRLFGPKIINVDTTYDSFKAISAEGLRTSSGNVIGRMRMMEFSNLLDEGLNVGKFTVRELAKMGDDSARFFSEVQKDLVASTDDILSFVDEATSSGKSGPTKIVRTTDYITDEGLKITTLREFYDDVVKTEQKVTSFRLMPTGGPSREPSFTTLDDLVNKVTSEIDDVARNMGTGKPSGSSSVTLLEEDPLKNLTDLGFRVREKPTVRVEVTPKTSPVGALKVPDISVEVERVLNSGSLPLGDFKQGIDTGSTKRSRSVKSSKTISHPEIKVIGLDDIEQEVFDLNTHINAEISSVGTTGRGRDYRIQTQVITPKDFHIDEPHWDIRDITDPYEDIDKETRAILSQVLDIRLSPEPKAKKPKYKTKKKKKRPIQTMQKKKKSSKKKTKSKGGEWGWWIGYEPLFDIFF
uniref:Coiled-coil domain protein n=1 Tax=Thermococcus sp. CIR10 TaxID=1197731 RepID=L0BAQ6_9EURY|nr:hypothetical protein [Thermococcus sp. CIR10]AFZ84259.1 Coiled-coil domain protein [Thermococcus sp. CIR10]